MGCHISSPTSQPMIVAQREWHEVGARAGGEVIAEATGAYGPLNITQSVTVNGPSGGVIYSSFPVNVKNTLGATVMLRGLTTDGAGATTGRGIGVVAVSFRGQRRRASSSISCSVRYLVS
jgi:hypothetical protein